MRTIPVIRERMKEIAEELIGRVTPRRTDDEIATELYLLADETRRRPAVRRAPKRKPNPDETLQARIRAYASTHPNVDFQDIGQRFGVNSGRVSEAIAGKRE